MIDHPMEDNPATLRYCKRHRKLARAMEKLNKAGVPPGIVDNPLQVFAEFIETEQATVVHFDDAPTIVRSILQEALRQEGLVRLIVYSLRAKPGYAEMGFFVNWSPDPSTLLLIAIKKLLFLTEIPEPEVETVVVFRDKPTEHRYLATIIHPERVKLLKAIQQNLLDEALVVNRYH